MISQAKLKDLISYNPDTGILTWIKPTNSRIKIGQEAGKVDNQDYRRVRIEGKDYRSHRLAWLYMTGSFPKGQLDHINGVRDDNRFVNLREVSHTDNHRNKKLYSNNETSGYTGVSYCIHKASYRAQIKVLGRTVHLGYFDDMDKAVEARKLAEIEHGFHPNHGRRI